MENRNCPRGATSYIWMEGDRLMQLALRFGVPEQSIRQANPSANFDAMTPGTTICIPQRMLACANGVLHPVRAGETIESIARAHNTTAGQIMERNPYVDPVDLVVGELLCVPGAETQDGPTPVPPAPPAPAPSAPPIPSMPAQQCPPGYTPGNVRYGETYGDILTQHNVSYQSFQLANPNLDMNRLLPGQRYCVPPTGSRGICSAGSRSHILEQGENLTRAAQRFGVAPAQMLRLNPNLAPGDFVPGRVICVG